MSIPIAAPAGPGVPVPAAVPRKVVAGMRPWLRWPRVVLVPAALLLAIGAVVLARRLLVPPPVAETVATEVVGLHDISQTVDATGSVEATAVVEIKSKASGQILKMPVSIGSVVKAGDLLAQIDPLTVRNQYDQLLAALRAAQSNVAITAAQELRAEQLYSREAMTAADHESALMGSANAQAALARAQADLVIAKQSLDDATVRAPSAGTIVEQDVTPGMVITSGSSAANGGTTLFKIADLKRIQMQALVGETDIGGLVPGMPAIVTVDAFPSRPFPGHVLKVEPQAVVQQSVTMFPVLIAIQNVNGGLLPGMNGEVVIRIATRSQVVAVPLDAVRSMRELPAVAATLGLDEQALRAQLQAQAGTASARDQVVMVQTARGLEARRVRLGISDFDYAEVLDGVKAGEVVALLSVAEQSAKRTQQQVQLAKRLGSGLPGSTGSAGTGGGARAGGGAAPGGGGH